MDKFSSFLKSKTRVLERIIEGGNISDTLNFLCRNTEELDPSMRCSVLYYDQDAVCMRHAAAPSLPAFYTNAIDGLPVGASAGSCGTAAFTGERVIVEDVYSHPFWKQYRDLAKQVGFYACWSQPFFSKDKKVLGTFAMYYNEVRTPSEEELELILAQAGLACIAIERKASEEALIESESRLSFHIQNTPVGAISWDRDFHCTEWNRAAENIFGYSADEALGSHACETIVPEGIRDDLNKIYGSLLKQKDASRNTNENTTKDGRTIICDWYNTPMIGRNGEITGVASLVQDITDRKHAEQQLRQAKEEAEKANKAKSEFLAAMSHDLRTPLNAIMGFSDMMRQKTFGPLGDRRYEEYIQDIHNSGALLVSLINDVLDLSKIEAGKYELAEDVISIEALVNSCIRQLSPLIEASNLTLTLEISPNLLHMVGDERALIQIFNNLISNAAKFTPGGGVVSVSVSLNKSHEIVIMIKDTGVGMSDKDIDKAMKPFEQTVGHHSRKHEGTGLGLHLCATLMQLFGGKLLIQSKVGAGTNVSLFFPPERAIPHT